MLPGSVTANVFLYKNLKQLRKEYNGRDEPLKMLLEKKEFVV